MALTHAWFNFSKPMLGCWLISLRARHGTRLTCGDADPIMYHVYMHLVLPSTY